MSKSLVSLCLALALAVPALAAEGPAAAPPQEPESQLALPADCAAASEAAPLAAPATSSLWDENECGAPCSPNGEWSSCVGYPPGCMWIGIGDCMCRQGAWLCAWQC